MDLGILYDFICNYCYQEVFFRVIYYESLLKGVYEKLVCCKGVDMLREC